MFLSYIFPDFCFSLPSKGLQFIRHLLQSFSSLQSISFEIIFMILRQARYLSVQILLDKLGKWSCSDCMWFAFWFDRFVRSVKRYIIILVSHTKCSKNIYGIHRIWHKKNKNRFGIPNLWKNFDKIRITLITSHDTLWTQTVKGKRG